MTTLSRRDFLRTGAAGALGAGALGAGRGAAQPSLAAPIAPEESGIHFLYDGLMVDPLEYARTLVSVHEGKPAKSDVYMAGGRVQELEARMASELGKEAAVFLATGTLANHLAIRRLAGETTKVLVQAESHIYADSMDCVQTLSRLNLVPLAGGRATITRDEVDEACRHAVDGPYPAPVGAMSIECPVRRRNGEVFDFEELKRISQYAKEHDLRLHLDGARLYIASAYTGIPPIQYADLVDTIYISLYKYLGAASGAILAGPKRIIEQVTHDRKVFGGALYQAWPFAAVALQNLDGFSERFGRAVAVARDLFARLQAHGRFRIEPIPHGTNIHRLTVDGVDGEAYRAALERRGVLIRRPGKDKESSTFLVLVNESLNRSSAPSLARTFIDALPS